MESVYTQVGWLNGVSKANETNLRQMDDGILSNSIRGVRNISAIAQNAADIAELKGESQVPIGSYGKIDTFQDADNIEGGTATYTGSGVRFNGAQTLELVPDSIDVLHDALFVKLTTAQLNSVEVTAVTSPTEITVISDVPLDTSDKLWKNGTIGLTGVV